MLIAGVIGLAGLPDDSVTFLGWIQSGLEWFGDLPAYRVISLVIAALLFAFLVPWWRILGRGEGDERMTWGELLPREFRLIQDVQYFSEASEAWDKDADGSGYLTAVRAHLDATMPALVAELFGDDEKRRFTRTIQNADKKVPPEVADKIRAELLLSAATSYAHGKFYHEIDKEQRSSEED